MMGWVLLAQSASLLIVTVVLCFALKQLLSLWKQMRNEFWVLFSLMERCRDKDLSETCAGNTSKSTSTNGACS